ncbi:branched-chain amino acid ABC transporter substrate-binding protein [Bailinhaonella thermotolerans]|uniref:Branched-chain amino acid ABC transporter substrate-binding protein n=2 Tax=Bailinhaonella thermotolerans TaxID=1070861 RepID=A0A3A4A9X8_9ACTN|nr:branched-chain amino acid ABC transporter substrate-binding protein [Bailinhaonella thermotolerans]
MAISLGLAACGGGSGGGKGGEGATELTIGVMGDLTGPDRALVIPPANGAELAVEEYNKKNPKVKVKLKRYDTQGKAEQAVNQVNQAIKKDKIAALIGPAFSSESRAVNPILQTNKIPSVTPSATATDLGKSGWKYWHRVVANDDAQGPQLAEFVLRTAQPKKAFMLSDQGEYGVGLAKSVGDTMKAKGVQIAEDKVDAQASDVSSTVAKIKSFQPDFIFAGGYYSFTGKMLKQIRDAGITALYASGDGSVDPALVDAAGKEQADNVVLSCACKIPFKSTATELKTFADAYKAKWNTDPLIYGTEGYDAANAILKAIEAGATTSEQINEKLKATDFAGVSKQIKFQENGEIATSLIYVYKVTKGEISLLGEADKAALQ